MATNESTGRKSSGTNASLPRITHHTEPDELGGERYARCSGCGRESILGENSILHRDGCPRSNQ